MVPPDCGSVSTMCCTGQQRGCASCFRNAPRRSPLAGLVSLVLELSWHSKSAIFRARTLRFSEQPRTVSATARVETSNRSLRLSVQDSEWSGWSSHFSFCRPLEAPESFFKTWNFHLFPTVSLRPKVHVPEAHERAWRLVSLQAGLTGSPRVGTPVGPGSRRCSSSFCWSPFRRRPLRRMLD